MGYIQTVFVAAAFAGVLPFPAGGQGVVMQRNLSLAMAKTIARSARGMQGERVQYGCRSCRSSGSGHGRSA